MKQLLALMAALATPAYATEVSNLRVDHMVNPELFLRYYSSDRTICVVNTYNKIVSENEEAEWYLTEDPMEGGMIFSKPSDGTFVICTFDEHIKLDIGVDDSPSKLVQPY